MAETVWESEESRERRASCATGRRRRFRASAASGGSRVIRRPLLSARWRRSASAASGLAAITSSRSPNRCTSAASGDAASTSSALRQRLHFDLKSSHSHLGAKVSRGIDIVDFASLHQRDAVATLGLIEIRSRHDDGHSVRGQRSQCIPEIAAGHRIHAGGGFVQQQQLRVRRSARSSEPASASCRRSAVPQADQ